MVVRPIVPLFPANDTSITNLNNVASCAAFVSETPVSWYYVKTTTQTVLGGSSVQVLYGTTYFDPDGVHGGNGAVIQTPGFYDCECTVPTGDPSSFTMQLWFQVTTGSANPLGAGKTLIFGYLSDLTTGTVANPSALTTSGTSPMLYPGDSVQVWMQSSAGVTVSATSNTSGNNDIGGNPDGGPYFTGQLISEGP